MHDFLDNLGAQQYEKLMEKMPPRKKSPTPAKKPTAKKSATRKPTTLRKRRKRLQRQLLRARRVRHLANSKQRKTTTRKKPEPKPTFKRKKLPIEELHPFSEFPFRLEYQDGKDQRICHFQCEDHRDKHIARYKLRKGSYIMTTLPKDPIIHLLCFLG